MPRQLLVTQDDKREFRITVPDNAKVTFAPFSPPTKNSGYRNQSQAVGTLRIYQGSKDNIIAMFTEVTSFRDTSNVSYAEKVAREEGATIWKHDEHGYFREDKVNRQHEWTAEEPLAVLESPFVEKKAGRKRK